MKYCLFIFSILSALLNTCNGEVYHWDKEVKNISARARRDLSDGELPKLKNSISTKDSGSYIFIDIFNGSLKSIIIYLPLEGISFFQDGKQLIESAIYPSTQGNYYAAKPNEKIIIPVKIPNALKASSKMTMPITAKGFIEARPIAIPSDSRIFKKINLYNDFLFFLSEKFSSKLLA